LSHCIHEVTKSRRCLHEREAARPVDCFQGRPRQLALVCARG
jgi:hypothetical protein